MILIYGNWKKQSLDRPAVCFRSQRMTQGRITTTAGSICCQIFADPLRLEWQMLDVDSRDIFVFLKG